MFWKKKVKASVILHKDDSCVVKGTRLDVVKMYLGCMETLRHAGVDLAEVDKFKDLAHVTHEE